MNETRLQELELKLARLEEEVRNIRRLVSNGSSEPWWKRTAGMFKDDPVFAEIVRLGRKIRREESSMEFVDTPKNSPKKGAKRNSRPKRIQRGK